MNIRSLKKRYIGYSLKRYNYIAPHYPHRRRGSKMKYLGVSEGSGGRYWGGAVQGDLLTDREWALPLRFCCAIQKPLNMQEQLHRKNMQFPVWNWKSKS